MVAMPEEAPMQFAIADICQSSTESDAFINEKFSIKECLIGSA
jgi:hypothetical protein